jgi:ArsR family transcriptional regulator
MLVERGPEGLPAGRISQRLELPPTTLSFHLAHLETCRLVTSRRDGRMIIYSANFPVMDRLMAYLTENCCGEAEDT